MVIHADKRKGALENIFPGHACNPLRINFLRLLGHTLQGPPALRAVGSCKLPVPNSRLLVHITCLEESPRVCWPSWYGTQALLLQTPLMPNRGRIPLGS